MPLACHVPAHPGTPAWHALGQATWARGQASPDIPLGSFVATRASGQVEPSCQFDDEGGEGANNLLRSSGEVGGEEPYERPAHHI